MPTTELIKNFPGLAPEDLPCLIYEAFDRVIAEGKYPGMTQEMLDLYIPSITKTSNESGKNFDHKMALLYSGLEQICEFYKGTPVDNPLNSDKRYILTYTIANKGKKKSDEIHHINASNLTDIVTALKNAASKREGSWTYIKHANVYDRKKGKDISDFFMDRSTTKYDDGTANTRVVPKKHIYNNPDKQFTSSQRTERFCKAVAGAAMITIGAIVVGTLGLVGYGTMTAKGTRYELERGGRAHATEVINDNKMHELKNDWPSYLLSYLAAKQAKTYLKAHPELPVSGEENWKNRSKRDTSQLTPRQLLQATKYTHY